ncbi:MAG: zinc-binding alcohol dehydrogenase [Hyphomicrobiales bacterium]|nr:zinc-binding alcohol dehydrogenase [Hyphomicrobiales bacterium]
MIEKTSARQLDAARALFYTATHKAEIRPTDLALERNRDNPKADVLVRSEWSCISRGTERLVFEGRVPESEWTRMRAPFQQGDFPFPVKYGYAVTGVVESGPQALIGRKVFCLYPHQNMFEIKADALAFIPKNVPPRRAALAANMETALNAVWDSGAGPADQILVIGGGLLGLLIAAICARLPGANVIVIDINSDRERLAEPMGAKFSLPADAQGEADVIFHTSASATGLNLAIEKAGFEARIVEVSWFGAEQASIALGGAFHSRRLQIISSQVGSVSPARRPRWPYRRRMEAALSLLADPVFDALITDEVAFEDLPQKLPQILASGAPGLATVVKY